VVLVVAVVFQLNFLCHGSEAFSGQHVRHGPGASAQGAVSPDSASSVRRWLHIPLKIESAVKQTSFNVLCWLTEYRYLKPDYCSQPPEV
jgi:hypothetical protein